MHDEICNMACQFENKSLNILGIYHPPPKQYLTNATFLDELTELLITRLPNLENPIILGTSTCT